MYVNFSERLVRALLNTFGKLKNTFETRCLFISCHQTRWCHSRWRQSSTSLQKLHDQPYQMPERDRNAFSVHFRLFLFNLISKADKLTVDSPKTLIFFSLLLWSIFPPPRHLHSIPKAAMAGLTFSYMWSVNYIDSTKQEKENRKSQRRWIR